MKCTMICCTGTTTQRYAQNTTNLQSLYQYDMDEDPVQSTRLKDLTRFHQGFILKGFVTCFPVSTENNYRPSKAPISPTS